MVRKSRSMQLSALAVATAIVIAPAAWSGGKVSGFQRPAQAAVASKPGQAQHDRFIITYRSGAKRMTSAATAQSLSAAARASGIGWMPMRTLATGSALIRTDRKLDRAASKRLMLALMKDPNGGYSACSCPMTRATRTSGITRTAPAASTWSRHGT